MKKPKKLTVNNMSIKEIQGLIDTIPVIKPEELIGVKLNSDKSDLNKDVLGGPPEPTFTKQEQYNIQGNIIPGFNKSHQHFLFYKFTKSKLIPGTPKNFLIWLSPHLTSMREVFEFRKIFRVRRHRLGKKFVNMNSTWVNVAFSHGGIANLTSKTAAAQFGEESFRQGLAERSSYLGDPTGNKTGAPSKWKVGGKKNEADMIIIVAADSQEKLEEMVDTIKDKANRNNMKLIFQQYGSALKGDLHGHEHFGFKDGVSQPGVRGRLSNSPGDYITKRYISNTDDRRMKFAKPGQMLTWPGQFLLGEQRQSSESFTASVGPATNFPNWAKHGSYLVVRRLNQNVPAFWKFAREEAQRLGMDHVKFASMLVGRWPSGAPLLRSPNAENQALGDDKLANNHFIFDDNTRPSSLRPISGYPGDSYSQAGADFLAKVCPHFAHIRKINPRDSVTDLGKPEDNLMRSILRRGIPFGPEVIKKRITKRLLDQERGLMFLGYASTIEDQFEFLQRRWANSKVQPNFGGHDPIIGQNGVSTNRTRTIELRKEDGSMETIKIDQDFVTPTGGGYFFAPTIDAVREVLGGENLFPFQD
ncbi:MAG: Dyp-type peroxidase [Crocinitomicaceae bacterium]|nr:Dyp-type peroxidase [Crocinitomicaceae bacterium]